MRLLPIILFPVCAWMAGCSERREAPPYAGEAGTALHASLQALAREDHPGTMTGLEQFARSEKSLQGSSQFSQACLLHETWRHRMQKDARAIRSGQPASALEGGGGDQPLLQALAALQEAQRGRPWSNAAAAMSALNRLKPHEPLLVAAPAYQEWRRMAQTEALRLEEQERGQRLSAMMERIDRLVRDLPDWQEAFREAATPEVAGKELAGFAEAVGRRASYPELQRHLRSLPVEFRPACQELLAWGFRRPELLDERREPQTSCGRLARILGLVRNGRLRQAQEALAELEGNAPLAPHVRQILLQETDLKKEDLLQPSWRTPAPGVADAAARLLLWQSRR